MRSFLLFIPRFIWRTLSRAFFFVLLLVFLGVFLGQTALVMSSSLASAAIALASRMSISSAISTTSDLNELRNREASSKRKLREIENDQIRTLKRAQALEADLKSAQNKLDQALLDKSDLSRQSKALHLENKKSNERILDLSASQMQSQKRITDLQDSLEATRRNLRQTQLQSKALAEQKKSLQLANEATFGQLRSLRKSYEKADIQIKTLHDDLKATRAELNTSISQNTALKDQSKSLQSSNAKAIKRAQLAELNLAKVPKITPDTLGLYDAMTKRITQRATVNATRNIASMPLEGLPIVGVLTIASVTALEVRDACQTAIDMKELRKLAKLPVDTADPLGDICEGVTSFALHADLTVGQCRDHVDEVRRTIGDAAAELIDEECDCFELPDGCPDQNLGISTQDPRLIPPPD